MSVAFSVPSRFVSMGVSLSARSAMMVSREVLQCPVKLSTIKRSIFCQSTTGVYLNRNSDEITYS